MAREIITDEMVEEEILRLQNSPLVKLARREEAIRNRRRQYMYQLRMYEKKGKALMEAGITREVLDSIDRDKSVMATSMYLTPLYDVDELYHSSQATAEKISNVTGKFIGYDIIIETDVVVIDLRPYMSDASKAPYWKSSYLLAGYEVVVEHEDIILVLEKK